LIAFRIRQTVDFLEGVNLIFFVKKTNSLPLKIYPPILKTIEMFIYKSLNKRIVKNVLGLLFFAFGFSSFVYAQKINGLSFGGPSEAYYTLEMFEDLKTSNATWVAIIPETTLDRSTLKLVPDEENIYWGATIAATIEFTKLAKQADLKVFLKPHIFLGKKVDKKESPKVVFTKNASSTNKEFSTDKTRGAEWRGDLILKNENDWTILETEYEAYILKLAKVADSLEVDLFSVGTELKQFAIKRPLFWKQLIQKVRTIYTGPLTYAANWDEYNKLSFWQDLDYIGVDTYFPINKMKTPSLKKTLKNWKSIQKQLRKFSRKENRKILLTEFGYRNISYAGKRPWTHDKGEIHTPNYQAQVNLYEAFFQTFWNKSWVAGGFSWRWFSHTLSDKDTSFSVQGKPALAILQKWYKK